MRRQKLLQLKTNRPSNYLIAIKHIKQQHSWDCGISCVLMVLPDDLRQQLLQNFQHVCNDEGFNRSIWTIDLCYLLSRFGINYTFYTITWGVNSDYGNDQFYKKVLSRDTKRVNLRFETAQKNGITIKQSSLEIKFLLQHLIYGPAIVLTNAKLLNCEQCSLNNNNKNTKISGFDYLLGNNNCFSRSRPYQGHFVVLCGYDLDRKKIFYRNPSLSDRICVTSVESFEKARKCYGTDEDLIFIYL